MRKLGVLRHHPLPWMPFRRAIILSNRRPVNLVNIQKSIERKTASVDESVFQKFEQVINYLLKKNKTRDASNFFVASIRATIDKDSELALQYGLNNIEKLPDERAIRTLVPHITLPDKSPLVRELLSHTKASPWKTRIKSKLPEIGSGKEEGKIGKSPTLTKESIEFIPSQKPPTLSLQTDDISKTKVACILDDFSFQCFVPEANFFQLSVNDHLQELKSFNPDIVFIESAWRGKDGLWGSKVGYADREVIQILNWCKENEVPTAFWNKEDPVHFKSFLNVAKLFDYVFTTDMDCIHLYKQALNHNRVFLLPFAFQPKLHNPSEEFERIDGVCFAGAYYRKYAERNKNLEDILDVVKQDLRVDIYDRNFHDDNPEYQFPEKFREHIVGTLSFEEINLAYKGYKIALNLNTIKNSQTMFARRVFELVASNTTVFSNYSQGVELLFGDTVYNSDSGQQILTEYMKTSPETNDKRRLLALRTVFSNHTYSHRFRYIISKISEAEISNPYGDVLVISYVNTQSELERVVESYHNQEIEGKGLLILSDEELSCNEAEGINFSTIESLEEHFFDELMGTYSYLSYFNPDSFYGPNFLVDMLHATIYTKHPITKNRHFTFNRQSSELSVVEGLNYGNVNATNAWSCLYPKRSIMNKPVISTIKKWSRESTINQKAFSIDSYNYIEHGQSCPDKENCLDVELSNSPIDFTELMRYSESILPAENGGSGDFIPASEIFMQICDANRDEVQISYENGATSIQSNLPQGKHTYLYWDEFSDPSIIGISDQTAELFLDATPGLRIMLAVIYLNEGKDKIGSELFLANSNITLTVPDGTKKIRLAIRVFQDGVTEIKSIDLHHRDLSPQQVITKRKVLVVSNNYPSYDDRYRNGFLHTRLLEYRKKGTEVDMFVYKTGKMMECREYEGTRVISGSSSVLEAVMNSNSHEKVLVHFLDKEMWDVLNKYRDNRDIIVWIHGSEIQPWHRRKFNYENEEQIEKAKIASKERMDFWTPLMNQIPENMHFVFVSNYFADEVMEDLGITLANEKYSIIHNPINTSLFTFHTKPKSHRSKILSIRPFASRKYANDLTVEAILHLSKKPIFKDLQFLIIGDGRLFDELLEPLVKFDNVTIQRRFLSHTQIADLHKEYGIFVCPTRMDSQGVSRDEAMSSGLVPITTDITAIPEFVDNDSGILTPPEDSMSIASAIEKLYHDEDLFQKLSQAAAARVRSQTASELIINQELKIINGEDCS